MRSLIFVGCNATKDVFEAIDCCDVVLLFEPLEEVARKVAERVCESDYQYKFVKVVQAACFTDNQPRALSVYNKAGLSSSLGTITAQAVEHYKDRADLHLQQRRQVSCVNLRDYMPMWLDNLVIDAQGADLTILKTIELWIQEKRIGYIRAECDPPGFRHYEGLPDNSREAMVEYLSGFGYDVSVTEEGFDVEARR